MGSTLGSALQSIGQTGNEVATGDINATLQRHQFTMDYLANQARNRQIDVEQQRANQESQIANASLNLQRQQQLIEQDRYERQGMVYAGTTRDANGNYNRVYQNPQTKQGVSIPYQSGEVPIDSPEGRIKASQLLQDAGIPKDVADKSVFGLTATGDPAEQIGSIIQLREAHDPKFKSLPYDQKLNWGTTTLRDMHPLTMPDLFAGMGGAGGQGGISNIVKSYQDKVDSGQLLLSNVPAAYKPFIDASNAPPQISPGTKVTLATKRAGLQNTLDLLDKVEPDLDLIKNIPGASLVDLAQSPDTFKGLVSRSLRTLTHPFLSKDDEARIDRLSGNLRSLMEGVNVIRQPLGATGFRGEEGWNALQGQAIRAIALPGVNKQVLDNTRGLVQGLIKAIDVGTGESSDKVLTAPSTTNKGSAIQHDVLDANGKLIGHATDDQRKAGKYTPLGAK